MQIKVLAIGVNCNMITKIYKAIVVAGGISVMLIISYSLNFPVDLKSIGIYLKTKKHVT